MCTLKQKQVVESDQIRRYEVKLLHENFKRVFGPNDGTHKISLTFSFPVKFWAAEKQQFSIDAISNSFLRKICVHWSGNKWLNMIKWEVMM